ncbi:MAG: hypothetical protein ACHBNF_08100 [Chromatiales bacterium]
MKVHIQYGPKPEHLAALRERLHPEIRLTVGDVPVRPRLSPAKGGRGARQQTQLR